MYDYLIVGAGLFGLVFAHEATEKGKNCLVIDKRNHIGGNIYTENTCGINVHKYGAHIFHTGDRTIWDYMNKFSQFNRYTNSPMAIYKDEIFNMPFNMNTFSKLWNVKTPDEAKAIIQKQISDAGISEPKNLKEQAIKLVGTDIYTKLVEGYTAKQWGKNPEQLPSFIIKRLPVRFTYDNNYFDDRFQGIPIGGYTAIAEKLLYGSTLRLNTDFYDYREELEKLAKKIIFTGTIDKYFNYIYGVLEYRSLKFETEILDTDNYQGNAVINYTDINVPYTRIIEHKHFEYGTQEKTVITKEYPYSKSDGEPYYPLNDETNNSLYKKYANLAKQEKNVIFGGRLGMYKYYDMDDIVKEALELAKKELNGLSAQ